MRSHITAIVVGAAILIGGYAVVQGGGGGGNSQGTFDCYGTTGCPSLPTPATCTSTISSGLQTALNNATGGEVICLNTGSYAAVSLTSKTYSSDVIVQPANNAAVTFSGATLNAVTHLHFTGNGGGTATMSIGGLEIDTSSGCSTHITQDYTTVTSATNVMPQFSCSHDMAILFDHNLYGPMSSGSREGRLNIFQNLGGSGPSIANGITISNNLFRGSSSTYPGGCSDGIYLDLVYGPVIGPGNEFYGIDQAYSDSNCGSAHVDPIAGFSDRFTRITGNYFHDNGTGSGGILSAGEADLTVTNNVFASTGYANSIVNKAPLNNMTVTHNVFYRNVETETGNGGETNGSGNVIRDNAWATSYGILIPNGTSVTYTADHNLGIDIAGSPTFVSSPASGYYHYVLDSSSPGYHAGSDGQSVGIVP